MTTKVNLQQCYDIFSAMTTAVIRKHIYYDFFFQQRLKYLQSLEKTSLIIIVRVCLKII